MSKASLRPTEEDLEERLRALQAELQKTKAELKRVQASAQAQLADPLILVESIPDGYILFDREFHPTFINQTGKQLYETIRQGSKGQAGQNGTAQISSLEETLLNSVFASGQIATIEYQVPFLAKEAYIEARYIPQIQEDGNTSSVLAILRDHTGRRLVSEARQVSDKLLRAALLHSRINVYTQDRDLCYNWVYDQQRGVLDQAYPGKTDEEFYTLEDAQRLKQIKKRVFETGKSAREEVDLTIQDQIRSFELLVEPLKNHSGDVTGILCSSLDITERRRTAQELERLVQENQTQKEELARRNELLQAIFEVDPSGLAVLAGENLEHQFVNPAYRSMLPYPEIEPVGRPYTEVWPQSENFRGSWLIQRVMQSGNPVHFERYPQQFSDGTTRYFSVSIRRLSLNNQPGALLVLWEVTKVEKAFQQAEKAAEEAILQAAEAQEGRDILDALLEYAPEGIAIASAREGRFTSISRYGKEMATIPLERSDTITLKDQPRVWQIYHLDGVTPAEWQELPLTRAIQSNEVILNEEWILQHPKGEPVYISCSAGPIRNQSGVITGGLLTWQDITERKVAEGNLEHYANRLEMSNRELEQFAFVASHDLQEPLRKIQAFSHLLIDRSEIMDLPEEITDVLSRMENASKRMQNMIRDLLIFSRVSTKTRPVERIDLNILLTEVLSDLEARIYSTQGKVIVDELPALYGDPMQIRQLFQNLVSNALKYHRPEVAPVVKISSRSINHALQKNKMMVEIFVEDNGIGFSVEHLDRIFQPFERLHGQNEFEGTGMGLAICQKIVERHQGTITAKSEPGAGSTFIVTLPVEPHL